jgi:competence protein ComEA
MRVESRHGRARDTVAARVRTVMGGDDVEPGGSPLGGLLQRLSSRWASARIDPGRRGAMAMAAAVVVAALVTGAWVLAARPHAEPVQAVRSPAQSAHPPLQSGARASPTGADPGSTAPSSGPVLVVDIAGKVRRPGIYRLPSGARVDDALRAAGGVLPGVDSTMVNWQRKSLTASRSSSASPARSRAGPGQAQPGLAGQRPPVRST